VYELEVHTAGSATNECWYKAISQQLALQLKSRLLENESLQQGRGRSCIMKETELKE
jgi:hypothetical protein